MPSKISDLIEKRKREINAITKELLVLMDRDGQAFIVPKNNKVNAVLTIILNTLSRDEMEVVKNDLIERLNK